MDRRKVLVEVKQGPHVNRLFHLLHKERIVIRQVRFSEHHVTFEIRRNDVSALRRIRRKSKVRLKLRYENTDSVLQLTTKTL